MRSYPILSLAAGVVAAVVLGAPLVAADSPGIERGSADGAAEQARADVLPMVPARILRLEAAKFDLPKTRVALDALADAGARQSSRCASSGFEWLDWKDVRRVTFRHDAVPDAVCAVDGAWDAFVGEVGKIGDFEWVAE